MKVLTEGKWPKEIEKKCERCGCLFVYEIPGDEQTDIYGRKFVECPTCKLKIITEDKPIPRDIDRRISRVEEEIIKALKKGPTCKDIYIR